MHLPSEARDRFGGNSNAMTVFCAGTIAAQASGTISNAQMYDVARKDQNNFNVMLEVSKKLSSVRKNPGLVFFFSQFLFVCLSRACRGKASFFIHGKLKSTRTHMLFVQELELTALIKNITSSARKLLDCQRGSLFLVSDDRK
eukprot:COSAG06_NODE_25481_length_635_cov_2.628731_1_plen_142_part_10